jgi:hypothetical protein
MARRQWAEVRKILEQDLLCDSLKGRVRYFATRYRKAHDGIGRVSILVDEKEIVNMPFSVEDERYTETHKRKKDEPDKSLKEIHEIVCADFAKKGLFSPGDFGSALDEFLSTDIHESINSNNHLIRMLAILDRRIGKRTLEKIKPTKSDLPEWLQFFYDLRYLSTILIAVIFSLLSVVCFPPPVFALDDTPVIIFNGSPLETPDAMPFMEQNEIMVPVKYIAEALGFKVSGWDAYRAFVHDEIHNIQLIVDVMNNSANRMFNAGDGRRRPIDNSVPPIKIGNHIYVPLRSFADAFDYNVKWDENTKTATLENQLDTPFFARKEVNTAHSLLNDRLIISMPDDAKFQNAHYGGIMGSSVADEYEINIVLFGNGQTLSVNISELYSYSTGDLNNDALLFIESINANEYHPLRNALSEPIRISDATIIMQPKAADIVNTDYIMGALVRAVDDTLIFASIYADQKAMTYQEDCKNLAKQIVDSIEVGTRSLKSGGQTLDMGDYTIQLVPGYVPKRYFQPDGETWYFIKLVTIGDTESYFGINRHNYLSFDDSRQPTKFARNIVLSRIIKWHIYTETRGVFDKNSFAEAILQTNITGWDMHMQIFASPASESDWKTIREMVCSLHDVNGTATRIIWAFYGIIFTIFVIVLYACIRVYHRAGNLKHRI